MEFAQQNSIKPQANVDSTAGAQPEMNGGAITMRRVREVNIRSGGRT